MFGQLSQMLYWVAAENQTIDTLLFGSVPDDCQGTLLFKSMAIVANFILGGVLFASTIGIVVCGVQIMTARDNPGQVAQGRKRIIDILIGLAVSALMYVIMNFLVPGGVTLDSNTFKYQDNACPDTPTLAPPSDPPSSEDPPSGEDPPGGSTGEYPSGYTPISGGSTVNGSGKTAGYKLVNTKQSVMSYYGQLSAHHVSQDGKLYTWNKFVRELGKPDVDRQLGHCDKFSRAIGHDLITNSLTSDACMIRRSEGGWHTVTDPDKNKILAATYNQLSNGRPVIMVVCWVKNGDCSRHFTTVVGYKASVTSGANLKDTDLMTLDTCGSLIPLSGATATKGMRMRTDNGSSNYRIDIPAGVMSQGKDDMTVDSCVQKWGNG